MAESKPDPIRQHQRDRFFKIILPVLAPAVILLVMTVVLFALAVSGTLTADQIAVTAGCLAAVFVLLPLAILMLIPSALMVFLGFASGSLPKLVRPTMDKLRIYTEEGNRLTQAASERISQPVIGMRASLERLQHSANMLIGLPEDTKGSEE